MLQQFKDHRANDCKTDGSFHLPSSVGRSRDSSSSLSVEVRLTAYYRGAIFF